MERRNFIIDLASLTSILVLAGCDKSKIEDTVIPNPTPAVTPPTPRKKVPVFYLNGILGGSELGRIEMPNGMIYYLGGIKDTIGLPKEINSLRIIEVDGSANFIEFNTLKQISKLTLSNGAIWEFYWKSKTLPYIKIYLPNGPSLSFYIKIDLSIANKVTLLNAVESAEFDINRKIQNLRFGTTSDLHDIQDGTKTVAIRTYNFVKRKIIDVANIQCNVRYEIARFAKNSTAYPVKKLGTGIFSTTLNVIDSKISDIDLGVSEGCTYLADKLDSLCDIIEIGTQPGLSYFSQIAIACPGIVAAFFASPLGVSLTATVPAAVPPAIATGCALLPIVDKATELYCSTFNGSLPTPPTLNNPFSAKQITPKIDSTSPINKICDEFDIINQTVDMANAILDKGEVIVELFLVGTDGKQNRKELKLKPDLSDLPSEIEFVLQIPTGDLLGLNYLYDKNKKTGVDGLAYAPLFGMKKGDVAELTISNGSFIKTEKFTAQSDTYAKFSGQDLNTIDKKVFDDTFDEVSMTIPYKSDGSPYNINIAIFSNNVLVFYKTSQSKGTIV